MIKEYFNSLADVLDAHSKSASFNQHRPDTGSNREKALIQMLNNHLPDRLRAISGGTVINMEEEMSKQIDVIVKSDLFPKFNQHDKSCVIVESVAGVISVKSSLDKTGLEDSIENVASVPRFSQSTLSLTNTSIIRPELQEEFTANWPFRVVFAYNSIDQETIYQHTLAYYNSNITRLNTFPEMIVVNKKICIRFLRDGGSLRDGSKLPPNYLNPMLLTENTQGHPIAGIIAMLNYYIPWMHFMKFNFSPYIDRAYKNA
jgi:hypothetical protein